MVTHKFLFQAYWVINRNLAILAVLIKIINHHKRQFENNPGPFHLLFMLNLTLNFNGIIL